jgi:hypothetical protein
MAKTTTTADCLYVCGDSWTHGSELIDPANSNPDHFAPVHEQYRLANFWPKLVADQLGLEVIDGSHPGAGNDRILRVAMYDVSRLLAEGRRPFVVVAWSQLHRFELPEGPKGENWRSFVSPKEQQTLMFAKEIWRNWSTDRSDVIKWLQQIICLDVFLKANQLDYITTTVFQKSYQLYEQYTSTEQDFFKPYINQITQHVKLNRHFLNVSLETFLQQQADIEYGPGGHPLTRGHQLIAKQVLAQIGTRFNFTG